jgi:hypothetical protein
MDESWCLHAVKYSKSYSSSARGRGSKGTCRGCPHDCVYIPQGILPWSNPRDDLASLMGLRGRMPKRHSCHLNKITRKDQKVQTHAFVLWSIYLEGDDNSTPSTSNDCRLWTISPNSFPSDTETCSQLRSILLATSSLKFSYNSFKFDPRSRSTRSSILLATISLNFRCHFLIIDTRSPQH